MRKTKTESALCVDDIRASQGGRRHGRKALKYIKYKVHSSVTPKHDVGKRV